MNIKNITNQTIDILRMAGIKNCESIMNSLENIFDNEIEGDYRSSENNSNIPTILSGKAPKAEGVNLRGGYYSGSSINQIPSDRLGSCNADLLVLCFDKDKLSERLREMLYSSGIFCQGVRMNSVFFTTMWDNKTYDIHKRAIEHLRERGMIFIFILATENGASEILI